MAGPVGGPANGLKVFITVLGLCPRGSRAQGSLSLVIAFQDILRGILVSCFYESVYTTKCRPQKIARLVFVFYPRGLGKTAGVIKREHHDICFSAWYTYSGRLDESFQQEVDQQVPTTVFIP